MLILTRRVGESIMIGPDIVVTVMQVGRGNQVRVGIAAPSKLRVDREEVRRRMEAEVREVHRKVGAEKIPA